MKFAVRCSDGKYIKRGRTAGILVKCNINDALLFDNIDEVVDCYFKVCSRYAFMSWDERKSNLSIVTVAVTNDYFAKRKVINKLDIIMRQKYNVQYKLSNGEIHSTNAEISVYKVLSDESIKFHDCSQEKLYNNIEEVKRRTTINIRIPRGSRQLSDLYGTAVENNIDRYALEQSGDFEIVDVNLISEVII